MSDAFVLDASMTVAWHFADEETSATAAVEQLTIEATVIVPGHWRAEVANALLVGERSGRATSSDSARFIGRLDQLDLVIDQLDDGEVMGRILPLARAHRLTVYDALYLEVAERRGLPLASLDKPLRKAASDVGVTLLPSIT